MLAIYQALASLALREFSDVVSHTGFVGGTEASPNKLRLTLVDGSFLEIWLSADGDYSYHWNDAGSAADCIDGTMRPTTLRSAPSPSTSTMAARRLSERVSSVLSLP